MTTFQILKTMRFNIGFNEKLFQTIIGKAKELNYYMDDFRNDPPGTKSIELIFIDNHMYEEWLKIVTQLKKNDNISE